MKICLSSTADNLDGQLDPLFGRCAYLLIVDPQTLQYEAIPNASAGATGGAGIQAAQTAISADYEVEKLSWRPPPKPP